MQLNAKLSMTVITLYSVFISPMKQYLIGENVNVSLRHIAALLLWWNVLYTVNKITWLFFTSCI